MCQCPPSQPRCSECLTVFSTQFPTHQSYYYHPSPLMIATISAQSHIMSPTMDHPFSRNSNSAGAPLPLIPRRASASRTHSAPSMSSMATPIVIPANVTIEQPTPPGQARQPSTPAPTAEDSDTSSSSTSDGTRPTIARPSKRIRGIPAVYPPEQSTPIRTVFSPKSDPPKRRAVQIESVGRRDSGSDDDTPRISNSNPSTSQPRIYAPGVPLRLNLVSLPSRTFSESPIESLTGESSKSAPVQNSRPVEARLVRKKSGQPVKSSLKYSKPTVRGSLSVVTRVAPSKSAPSTPTHAKAVHFDAQLEHVKLFLAEQKPLAVSRDGSPTEDTSGTDSDFPSFIYGGSSNEKTPRRTLVMQITNMPAKVNADADVALEELLLSPDTTSILGRVKVRNIAFQKWLAVRFTFDSWQTTSEVTAKYVESIDSVFDRFSFSIRLNDLLARIEGKTLLLALRYTAAGREIWDNNGGQNYLATFTKLKAKPELPKSDDEEGSARSDMADLKSKLEQVARGRESAGPAFLAQHHSRQTVGKLEDETPPNFKTGASLASRYDFGTSLRNPWKPAVSSSPSRHNRTHSYPIPSTPTSSSIPWPEKTHSSTEDKNHISVPVVKPRAVLGSPRDVDDAFPRAPYVLSHLEDSSFPVPSRDRMGRNHQRGYFDINIETSGVKKTPPGTPRMRSLDDLTPLTSPRLYSYPPVSSVRSAPLFGPGLAFALSPRAAAHPMSRETSEGSDESTPSIISPSSSSRSESPSPSESFMIAKFAGQHEGDLSISPRANYRQLLNK